MNSADAKAKVSVNSMDVAECRSVANRYSSQTRDLEKALRISMCFTLSYVNYVKKKMTLTVESERFGAIDNSQKVYAKIYLHGQSSGKPKSTHGLQLANSAKQLAKNISFRYTADLKHAWVEIILFKKAGIFRPKKIVEHFSVLLSDLVSDYGRPKYIDLVL
ncbi:hypothetical protein DPMN_188353 [Dreissena polymorpha]|uniref:Uncharacterized protein n=1 Tax=Dreissena polymorpha TaxID=45954 RepID=A0A9D4DST0_DREPO|nr:hypothetical protein DPMN_188353 [Dreissena polymorpha]